jgi:hypothetical protein
VEYFVVRIYRRTPATRARGQAEDHPASPHLDDLRGVVEDHRGRQAPFQDAAELWRLLCTRLAGARRPWNGTR